MLKVVQNHNVYYVHTDQLGTPRAITDGGNSIVWKWNNINPFGKNLPSVQNIIYNKRFAGQYFDNESNLHYNYYRTYNPLIGRYIQSDPIGLAAGFNTYNYVEGNPLGATDSLGLKTINYGLGGTKLVRLTYWTEELIKSIPNYDSNDILRLLSHGNPEAMHGNSPEKLAEQIISGQYKTDSGLVKDNYFEDMIKQGKDINIKLDACDTGAYYTDPLTGKLSSPYAYKLGLILKQVIKSRGLKNNIIIEAPNAETTFWLGEKLSNPIYLPQLNGVPKLMKFKF